MFIITGCSNAFVEEKFSFENEMWLTGDQKSIEITAPDTLQVYQLELSISHADNYGFQNLYVRTNTTFPSGKIVTSVTSLELANADATWAGDCSGDVCKVTLPLQSRFTFPEAGKYTWKIEPFMRTDTVQGIESIEVIFREVKS